MQLQSYKRNGGMREANEYNAMICPALICSALKIRSVSMQYQYQAQAQAQDQDEA